MNNPYTARAALRDATMFFGRGEELEEVAAFLRGGQSISIVGPRKIGKSSLLLQLIRRETAQRLQIAAGYLFLYVDCQSVADLERGQILAHLAAETAAGLRDRGMEPEPLLRAVVAQRSQLAFDNAVRRLNDRGLKLVILLDEFEQWAANPNIDVNLYMGLRSAAGRLQLSIVTASAQPIHELTYAPQSQITHSSPFFNIFGQLYLGLLPESDARRLIREPMELGRVAITSELEDFIYDLVGGHPLGIQIACCHAWDEPDDLQRIEHRTTEELEGHFRYYWRHLSIAERQVVRNPPGVGEQDQFEASLRKTLQDLTRKCLLIQRWGSYVYPSRAWAEYIATGPDGTSAPSTRMPSALEVPGKDESEVGETAGDRDPTAHSSWKEFLEVLRESLPKMLGEAGGTLLIGLGGLVLSIVAPFLGTFWRNVSGGDLPAGLARLLAVIGVLVVIFVVIRMLAGRRRHQPPNPPGSGIERDPSN